jgi:hypothetical protein
MRLSMPLDLRNEGSIMFAKRLVTQLAGTMAQRLWLLVLPLAMLTTACAGLIGSTSKPAIVDTTPPTVSITSPTPAATVSGTITVTANASDKVPVASVQFQVDGSNFGALDASAPYSASLNTGTLTNGKHSLTAVAIDTAGNKATSSAVSVTVNNADTTPPSVSITSPASGATVSGAITVTANASDSVALASVQFQVDASNFGALETSAPYSASLNTGTLTNGKHSLTAVAIDTAGNKATSSAVSITVNNADTTPPSVSITSPASGATVSGTIVVTANASDSVAVASVQFQVDGSNFGVLDTSAPYSASLSTGTLTNGKHSLTAVAIDTAGNKATSSAVSITVNNTGNTTPPTVSVTSPASGATVSGTITVTANAADSVAVASVQFQVNGSNLGAAVTSAPYSASLNTTTLTNGAHTLTAIATDTSNNKTTSAGVSITVNNQATNPVIVSIVSPVAGAAVSGTIAITATATATAGVAGVQFQLDGADLVPQVTASPYSVSWNTTTATEGSHTLSATATDTKGNAATAQVNVTVNNSSNIPPGPGWTKLSYTELKGSENTSPCEMPIPAQSDTGCVAMVTAWNSAVADTSRNRLLLWGGGHEDYSGNEVYSVDLTQVGLCTSSNPCISRLDNYSPPNLTDTCVETLSDGRPNARHTYDGLAYVASIDSLFSVGGSLNFCGFGGHGAWLLALDSVLPTCAPNCVSNWTNQPDDPGTTSGLDYTTAYDSINNRVWMMDSSSLYYFDVATSTWHTGNSNAFYGDFNGTAVYDSSDQYVIRLGAYSAGITAIHYWSVASGSSYTMNTPTLDGSCAGILVSYPGLVWDPVDQVVVGYPGSGNTIWLLSPKTWTCTTETHGSTKGVDYPQDANANLAGIFKHFNYFPSIDTYVVCNDPNNDCWSLKRH